MVSNRENEKFVKGLKNTLTFQTPLQFVKGVGPILYQKFQKKDLHTIEDLLYFFPRKYQSQKVVTSFQNLVQGEYACVVGEVFGQRTQRRKQTFFQMNIRTHQGRFVVVKYFKLPYKDFFKSFEIGQEIKICGIVQIFRGQIEFHHPEVLSPESQERIIPVYSEIENISQKKIRNIIKNVFQTSLSVQEDLPLDLIQNFKLLSLENALKDIHLPQKDEQEKYLNFTSLSQRSLIFREFFKLQLYLNLKKLKLKNNSTQAVQNQGNLVREFQKRIPFEWTKAQKKVFKEIVHDLNKNVNMRRLIQGDVGCGKTSVALQACCYVIESGFQTVFMVPTEILAEQHFKKAQEWMEGLRVELLTSKTKNKAQILEKLKQGDCDLCIGTQALIQDSVQFKNLGLVVIDEQHKFGVHQRARLCEGVHCLVMTATPIPRTLAMVLYADLDVSIIDELPQGRPPVITRKTQSRREVFEFLEKEVLKGRQAYVIYPLVEESEKIDLKNACMQFEKLQKAFPQVKWGLLHGKMTSEEKSDVMKQFKDQKIQVLVTTTVIEVGIDIPQATIMIVEHSERFGLSQLHQLRGRVGRGSLKSYCILIAPKNCQRASIMEEISDGFRIAEEDLKLRGAGEFLGKKQSGAVQFKIADLHRDSEILQQSNQAVKMLIEKDPYLERHSSLKQELESFNF